MKKGYTKLLLLTVALAFSLLFFLCLSPITDKKSAPQNQITKTSPGLPMRLTIPAINVDTKVQHVSTTLKGEMETPSNTIDVGWFNLGPRPGEKGSAVIAGHFNGENGEAGVFANLDKLKKGDKLNIQDDKGMSFVFVVREKRTYDPGYADYVFSSSDSAHLNLITCDGVWNVNKKSYSKRMVVFTDIAQ